jgi:hypothetical protein
MRIRAAQKSSESEEMVLNQHLTVLHFFSVPVGPSNSGEARQTLNSPSQLAASCAHDTPSEVEDRSFKKKNGDRRAAHSELPSSEALTRCSSRNRHTIRNDQKSSNIIRKIADSLQRCLKQKGCALLISKPPEKPSSLADDTVSVVNLTLCLPVDAPQKSGCNAR